MGEWRDPEEEDPVGDWQFLIESYQQMGMPERAEAIRAAGPPPIPGVPAHSFVVIDTDIGGDADDAIALATAALWLPELALVITSDECGGQRARFARHLLDLLGRQDVPVVAGIDLGNRKYFCVEDLIPDRVPRQPTDLIEHLERLCATATLPVRWIGMGPLSNLAHLARTRPDLARRLEVTQMGGALRYRDPSRAEHNFRLDPNAAHQVLASIQEPQLVTSDITFTDELAIHDDSPLYRALAEPTAPPWAALLQAHLDHWFQQFHPSTIQHDALTLAAAMEVPFVGFTRAHIALDEQARMRTDPDGTIVWLSSRADYQPFINWLTRRLTDAKEESASQHTNSATSSPNGPAGRPR